MTSAIRLSCVPIRRSACPACWKRCGRVGCWWPTRWAAACWSRRGCSGFLPKINQYLFGEELILPSIATWWCGEAPVLAQALEKLPELLIKPAFPSQSFAPVFGRDLSEKQRQALAERMQARPYAYVAQELAQLSQAPIWQAEDGQLQPRAIGMRMYAVASRDGYRVLPGGLTRVAAEADAEVVSMQRGGASKDTWVLGERPPSGEQWKTQRNVGVHDLVRRDPYLPSRVVENLFWFGRYCERCDDSARLLRIMLARYVDGDDPQALQAAVDLGERLTLLPDEGELPERLLAALLGEDWSFSLRSNLQRLQWAASQVRGKLSRENWQALVELQREAMELDTDEPDFGELLDFLNRLVMSLAALSGFALDDMTRDEGWRFLMIGRRIERLQFLSSSLAAFLRGAGAFDQAGLEWLLELGNSSITYRSRYLAVAQLIPVLDLLLLDEQNPHAVLFQLKLVTRTLKRLNDDFGVPREAGLPQLVERLARFDLGCLENSLFGESSVRAASMVWRICCKRSPRPAGRSRIAWPCAISPMSMMSASARCPSDERAITRSSTTPVITTTARCRWRSNWRTCGRVNAHGSAAPNSNC